METFRNKNNVELGMEEFALKKQSQCTRKNRLSRLENDERAGTNAASLLPPSEEAGGFATYNNKGAMRMLERSQS
jgi:hypothetical protein